MERYETIKKLASGSYGDVYLCKDKEDEKGGHVAIKVFPEANNHPQVLKSAMREAALLQLCKGQPHVVHMIHACRSESGRVYIVLEYLPRVLSAVIKEHKETGGMPIQLIWKLLRQLLLSLKFLHKQQLIHRDLKPGNIMLTMDDVLKVIDLGLARQCRPHLDKLTEYVQTRWYRAPEVLVGLPYGFEVDIWAVGCIAAEMVTGGPVFCGKSHVDQLQVILDCFGALPRRLMAPCVEAIDDKRLRVPSALEVKGIKAKLRKDTPQALLDFIMSCLQLDPLKRPSAEELLHLPHFQDGTSGTAFAKTFKKSPISSPVLPTPDRVLHSLTGSSNVNSVHYKGEPVPTRFNKIREEEENGHPGQVIQHSEKTGKAAGVRAPCLPEKASQTTIVKDMDSFVRARGVSDCGALKSMTAVAGTCRGVMNRVKVTVLATGASPAAGLIAAHRCSLSGVEAAAAAAPASVVPPGAPLLAPGAFSGASPSRRLTGSQQAQPRRRLSQQGSVTGANSSARETSNSCSLYTSLQILPPGTTFPRSKDSFQQQGFASGLTSAQDSLAGDASCHNSNAGRASRSLSPLPPLPLTPSTNVREGSFTSSQIRHMGFRRISTTGHVSPRHTLSSYAHANMQPQGAHHSSLSTAWNVMNEASPHGAWALGDRMSGSGVEKTRPVMSLSALNRTSLLHERGCLMSASPGSSTLLPNVPQQSLPGRHNSPNTYRDKHKSQPIASLSNAALQHNLDSTTMSRFTSSKSKLLNNLSN